MIYFDVKIAHQRIGGELVCLVYVLLIRRTSDAPAAHVTKFDHRHNMQCFNTTS